MSAVPSNSSSLPPLPHSRCNYLTDDGMILVGAQPEPFSLSALLAADVRLFINLASDEASAWYVTELPSNIVYLSLPTASGHAPDLQLALAAVDQVKAHLAHSDCGRVYVHCCGGHGRAGTFAALLIGHMNEMSGDAAITCWNGYKRDCRACSESAVSQYDLAE